MFRNVASQKIQLFAFTTATGAPTTGDAANLTAYVTKDHGTPTALTDTSASEQSSTNAPGVYLFDLTQGETDANELTFSGKSSTSGVTVVPRFVSTFPATGILAPATAGRTLVVDAAGLADANVVKVGPTGSGTAQTAGDLQALITTVDTVVDSIALYATRTTLRGTASGTPSTTSIPTSAMTPATSVADQLKGRIVVFDDNTTTAALRGQATDITASSASATPTLTVTALTTAPVSGDTFTVV